MKIIFEKIKIISDISDIISKYLSKSQNDLLNKNVENTDIDEIIKYDSKLIVSMKKKLKKHKIFGICVEYEKQENMKWLLKNKYPFYRKTFEKSGQNRKSGNYEMVI